MVFFLFRLPARRPNRRAGVLAALLAAGLVFGLTPAAFARAASPLAVLQYLTEEYPPYTYTRNGTLHGAVVELVEAVLREAGTGLDRTAIQAQPWARAYRAAREVPGTCLIVMTRTPERERLFLWAGPLAATRIVVLARKGAGVSASTARDLRKYRIGVVRDDVGHQLLAAAGYPEERMDLVPLPEQNAEKLARGRIDAWVYEEDVARFVLAARGYDPDDFEAVYTLKSGYLYVAFSPGTPAEAVAAMQEGLDRLRGRGEVRAVLERHGLREVGQGRAGEKRRAAPP
jgi:ABC-type amino acid transport substrate-binding protein